MNSNYLEGRLSTLKHEEYLAKGENERRAQVFHTWERISSIKSTLSLSKLRLSLERIGIL